MNNKKQIKVKPIFGAHQIYQEIANFPPKNTEYIGVSKGTKKGEYYQKKKFNERINRLTQKLKVPRIILIKPGDFDLIHSSRGIIPIQPFSNKPWVMDIEQFTSFMGLNFDIMAKSKFVRWFVKKRLESKNCKKILCHCEATKKSFEKYFISDKFKDKLEVLYPSSHITPFKKKKNEKIRFLAVLSIFNQKGGKEILEAFSNLEKKYKNIELWIKGDPNEEIKRKFSSPNIKFFSYMNEILPREEFLKKFYFNSDVLLYTTFCDSFGYSLIDGLVSGLPIITTNLFASPEVVENNKNGFVLKIPGYKRENWIQEYLLKNLSEKERKDFVLSIEKAMEKLIKNKSLREKMGKESLNLVKEGKFSIKERNKKLRRIYEEALK